MWDTVTVYVTNPTNSAETFTVTLRKDDGTVLFSTRRAVGPHATYATFKGCPGQTRAQSCATSAVISARTAALAPSLAYEVPYLRHERVRHRLHALRDHLRGLQHDDWITPTGRIPLSLPAGAGILDRWMQS
jgi:hypothetical protein